MTKSDYPNYVRHLLNQARQMSTDQTIEVKDTLRICIEILALYPDYQEAADLVLEIFSEPRLIYENRQALCVDIEEWDDRPHQFRARLAKSFHLMCCWSGHQSQHEQIRWQDISISSDVAQIIDVAMQFLYQDAFTGDSSGQDVAWYLFRRAVDQTDQRANVLLKIAYQYACAGYFAEAAELLHEMLAEHGELDDALRLWAEVSWWRDHQYQIPWIPPYFPGNGRRWQRIHERLNPEQANLPKTTKLNRIVDPEVESLSKKFQTPPSINLEVIHQINSLPVELDLQPSNLVDWEYLEKLEDDSLCLSDFPEWAQYLIKDIDDPTEEIQFINYLLRLLSNPTNNPNRKDHDNLA